MPEELPILYRDEHIVVIDKPPGLLVHRSEIDRHETRFAIQILRDQIGQHVWPAHRLDRGTSGVLLFGLNKEMASLLGRQFEAGAVDKQYLAVVRGFPPASGTIDHALSRQRDTYEFQGERSSTEAQSALTHFRKLAEIELPVAVDRYPSSRYALLALAPVTGRRHQIRRHLKHIAHPIIGDATYGKGRHNRYFADELGCHRLLLACVGLSFDHPVTQQRLKIKAPVSGEFAATLARFNWPTETA
ncbi:tRNA pseudouridine(65) synthase TruC [Dechloromonas sp. HYN0024]|uniref:tRNA pseudouridine(65) synthase TruC n=1 Tax=Dechloromonas sp. HYN0024 TaxID=2231055 RepID=UPI001F083116|nr:tRNA pseudouridine(65) synthase TruC [Dechloromonas sp. HYN0024]